MSIQVDVGPDSTRLVCFFFRAEPLDCQTNCESVRLSMGHRRVVMAALLYCLDHVL